MSELDAARKCLDMLLRKEAVIKNDAAKRQMIIKIKEMQSHISFIHRRNRGL